MTVDVGNYFGRRIEKIGADADDAVRRRAAGAAVPAAGFLVWRRRHLHHSHRMIRMLFVRAQSD